MEPTALDLARSHTQEKRLIALEQQARIARNADARRNFAVPFVGWRNGIAYGRMPDGGLIEVAAGSNGAVRVGDVVMAQRGGDGSRAIGRWMPR